MNLLFHQREQILQQMEQIKRMERGSLQAEKRPSVRHPDEGRGPITSTRSGKMGRT